MPDREMTSERRRPDVSILVVAYNSAGVIKACLGSIPQACTRYAYEVLLIDNGDGSTEALVKDAFPETQIVASKGNVGFAAGNNLLADAARGTYVLLLNPDVELKPNAIDLLLAAASDHRPGSAWGGVTLGRNEQPDLGNTVHVPSLREMASRVLGFSSAAKAPMVGIDEDAQVQTLSGSFVMLHRAAWDEVGGLDERYFLYCEEVDLFYRLGQRGHVFWRIGAARGYHEIGHGSAITPMRMLYRAAGTMQFAKLHWGKSAQMAAFLFTWLGAVQRFIVGRLIGRRSKHFQNVGESHRLIALRPHYWRRGYDPEHGLLTKLANDRAGREP